MQLSSALTNVSVKTHNAMQENVGPGLTYDQNRGDPSNPETGKGGSLSQWGFANLVHIIICWDTFDEDPSSFIAFLLIISFLYRFN